MVEDNAPLLIADSIAALLAQKEAGMNSANSIRASVNGFSWSNIAEAIIPEYSAILKEYK
jgi:hypothetical protein